MTKTTMSASMAHPSFKIYNGGLTWVIEPFNPLSDDDIVASVRLAYRSSPNLSFTDPATWSLFRRFAVVGKWEDT